MNVVGDVVVDQCETRFTHEVFEVVGAPGNEVVDTCDRGSRFDEPSTQVRAEEACAPEDDDTGVVEVVRQFTCRFAHGTTR